MPPRRRYIDGGRGSDAGLPGSPPMPHSGRSGRSTRPSHDGRHRTGGSNEAADRTHARAEFSAFGKAGQVPSEGMPMHAVSANDLAFQFCGGHPQRPVRDVPCRRTSGRILTGLVLRDAGRSHELEAPESVADVHSTILERDGPGPKQPYGGTNLEPQLAGQCGMPAAPSRWALYAWPDPVSADGAWLRLRSCAAWKDVARRRLATGQGPRRAMPAAGVSAGDELGRPGLVPQG